MSCLCGNVECVDYIERESYQGNLRVVRAVDGALERFDAQIQKITGDMNAEVGVVPTNTTYGETEDGALYGFGHNCPRGSRWYVKGQDGPNRPAVPGLPVTLWTVPEKAAALDRFVADRHRVTEDIVNDYRVWLQMAQDATEPDHAEEYRYQAQRVLDSAVGE